MNSENAQNSFEKGKELFKNKKFEEASKEFEKAVATDAGKAEIWFYWANCCLELSKYEQASEKYRTAKNLGLNKNLNLHCNWAESLSRQNKYDEALRQIKTAHQINKKSDLVYEIWGNIHFDNGEFEKAQDKYLEAKSLNDSNHSALFNLGLTLFHLRKFKEAKIYTEEALRLSPLDSSYETGLADVLVNVGEYDRAEKIYQKLFESDQAKTAIFFLNWGLSLYYLEEFDKAIEKFNEAQKLKSDSVEAFLYRGYATEGKRLYEAALLEYDKFIEHDPKKVDGFFAKGTLQFRLREFEQAILSFDRSIECDPNFSSSYYNRALLLKEKGKYIDSWKDWEQIKYIYDLASYQRKLEDSPHLCVEFGSVLYNIFGEFEIAEELFNKAVGQVPIMDYGVDLLSLYLEQKDINSENESLYHWKAKKLFGELISVINEKIEKIDGEVKRLQNEIDAIESIYKTDEDLTPPEKKRSVDELKEKISFAEKSLCEVYYQHGSAYLEIEDFEKALTSFKKADDLTKNLPAIQSAIGICYSNLGKHVEAIFHLEASIDGIFDDFITRNNLASAYLKASYDATTESLKSAHLEKAEREYRKVLREAINNIDSHIGLGNVLFELAELGNQDLYEESIENYTKALELSTFRKGSKRLTNKEIATILYSRGFVATRVYTKSNLLNKQIWIRSASNDFQKAYFTDPNHLSSKRANEVLKQTINLNSDSMLERISPYIILLLAFSGIVLAVLGYIFDIPKALSFEQFVALVAGSSVFLVVGISLPLLVRLKVGTFELEKKIKENIPQRDDFGMIKKQIMKNPFSQNVFYVPLQTTSSANNRTS